MFTSATVSVILKEPLRILTAVRVENEVEIRWSSVPGAVYQLQYKNTVEEEVWSTLPEQITADSSESSRRVAVEPVIQKVYRVLRLQ